MEITLTDENDESPRFVNVPRPFLATVQTNAPPGTSVYQLMATDDDQHSTIQYTLESGKFDSTFTTGHNKNVSERKTKNIVKKTSKEVLIRIRFQYK